MEISPNWPAMRSAAFILSLLRECQSNFLIILPSVSLTRGNGLRPACLCFCVCSVSVCDELEPGLVFYFFCKAIPDAFGITLRLNSNEYRFRFIRFRLVTLSGKATPAVEAKELIKLKVLDTVEGEPTRLYRVGMVRLKQEMDWKNYRYSLLLFLAGFDLQPRPPSYEWIQAGKTTVLTSPQPS